MRHEPMTRDYPGGWEFDAADDAEVEMRLQDKAAEYLAIARADAAEARELVDSIDDLGEFLMEVLAFAAELREPASCFTAEERIERFGHKWDKLLRPIAEARASWDRGEIERELINESRGTFDEA